MTIKPSHFFLVIFFVLLQGCETAPIQVSEAHPVPKERLVTLPVVDRSSPDLAAVTVTRDSGMFGSGPSILLSIDKQEIAYFRTSETLSFPIAAGEHLVSIVPSPAFGAAVREFELYIKPKVHNYYRISVTQGGILFQRTSESQ